MTRWLLLVAFVGCAHTPSPPRPRPPNILLLQADDLGFDDLGRHNPQAYTPHLDALAKQSVVFSDFYVTPVCAPTRAALLTGRHHLRTGVSHVHGGKDFVHRDEWLLPQALQQAGYRTGMWGKWHTGKTDGYWPWQRGFDEAYAAALYVHRNSHGSLNGRPVSHRRWADEVIVDYALDFIGRGGDRPFFAYLSFLTCHSPLAAKQSWIDHHRERGLSQNLATLFGMVSGLDSEIGRLLAALQERGVLDDTVVIFLSDNGPADLGGQLSEADHAVRRASGMKGRKGDVWEGGIRSPLFVHWPPRFAPGAVAQPVDVTSLYPTLLALAGATPDPTRPPLDGVSFLEHLADRRRPVPDRPIFFYAHPAWPANGRPWTPAGILDEYAPVSPQTLASQDQVMGVRLGRHKLLVNANARWLGDVQASPAGMVLFDVAADRGEANSLHDQQPGLVRTLAETLHAWQHGLAREAHALAAPAFRIGDGRPAVVLAYAPAALAEGLVNQAEALAGWQRAGQFADYEVEVEVAGRYRPALVMEGETNGAAFALSVTTSAIASSAPASALAPLDLGRGRQRLRLTLTRAPVAGSVSVRQIELVAESLSAGAPAP